MPPVFRLAQRFAYFKVVDIIKMIKQLNSMEFKGVTGGLMK